jgi:hypothetical protein
VQVTVTVGLAAVGTTAAAVGTAVYRYHTRCPTCLRWGAAGVRRYSQMLEEAGCYYGQDGVRSEHMRCNSCGHSEARLVSIPYGHDWYEQRNHVTRSATKSSSGERRIDERCHKVPGPLPALRVAPCPRPIPEPAVLLAVL